MRYLRSTHHILAVGIVIGSSLSASNAWATDRLPAIDVFTTENRPVRGVEAFLDQHPDATLRIHRVDGIERIERELSVGLSNQPEIAKGQALHRLQALSGTERDELEQTARALAEAMELGIEAVPAMVFDRQWVVYGIVDPSLGLNYFQARALEESE